MLAKPFIGPIGEGELEIPTVRGVSGSLVYFVDQPDEQGTIFDVDFVPDPEPEVPPELGLIRIDHVAQVVPETERLHLVQLLAHHEGLDHTTEAPSGPATRWTRRGGADFEASIASATAWLFLASVKLLMRRLARL